MKNIFTLLTLSIILIYASSCRKEKKETKAIEIESTSDIPEFFKSDSKRTPPEFRFIAGTESKLNQPQDLDFNTNPARTNELWIVNKDNAMTGGSTVMITQVGQSNQAFDWRRDGNAWHFMSQPSALSFSKEKYNWATTHNIQDANHAGGTFAGPSLWSSDLNIYAINHGPGTNGSHLDMLHGSPFSMGIETHQNNAFWVFDGYNKELVFYDFVDDHGPGMHDHSDGIIHRYADFELTRNPDVPSHLVLDENKKWLYIVDGGTKRILRMDVNTGSTIRTLPLRNEALAEHLEKGGTTWEVFVPETFGLISPCGIEIVKNKLFVSDHETGEIVCFDTNSGNELARINTGKKGIMGIKYGPDKKLYYVNATENEVRRVDPN